VRALADACEQNSGCATLEEEVRKKVEYRNRKARIEASLKSGLCREKVGSQEKMLRSHWRVLASAYILARPPPTSTGLLTYAAVLIMFDDCKYRTKH
jgi:hypothetical protein